jgi:hypothetical protein
MARQQLVVAVFAALVGMYALAGAVDAAGTTLPPLSKFGKRDQQLTCKGDKNSQYCEGTCPIKCPGKCLVLCPGCKTYCGKHGCTLRLPASYLHYDMSASLFRST